MDHDIQSMTHTAIELILCAMVISAVAICCTLGYKLYYDKQALDDKNSMIAAAAELYYYDNKVVSGSDALELMMTNTRRFSYWFDLGSGSDVEISTRYENTRPAEVTNFVGEWTYRDYWSEASLKAQTYGFIHNNFKAKIVYDSSKTFIKGILFEMVVT